MNNKLFVEADVKALADGEFEVIASTSDKDRMGDIIKVDGWDLKNFKKNPVMLWAHNNFIPPISKAKRIWVEDGKLKLKGVFANTPLANEIKELVSEGFINAVSVGFIPLMRIEDEGKKKALNAFEGEDGKWYARMSESEIKEYEEKGFFKDDIFIKQELLEVSWVCVPALPQALVTARKDGFKLGAIMTKAIEQKEIKDFEATISEAVEKDVDSQFDFIPRSEVKSMVDKAVAEAINNLGEKNPVEKVELSPNLKVEEPVVVGKGKGNTNAELKLLRMADKAIEAVIRTMKANHTND